MPHPAVGARVRPLPEEGAIATCAIVDLEVLFSARNLSDYDAVRPERQSLDESADLTLLHYDGDYELIAAVTGRAHEWVASSGSL